MGDVWSRKYSTDVDEITQESEIEYMCCKSY